MVIRAIVPIVKVSDMKISELFYCSMLGFSNDGMYASTPEGPFYLSVTLNNCYLHLSTFPGDGPSDMQVYIAVDDVDSLYEKLKANGLEKAELEPTDQTWGMRELYILDPDGNGLRFGARIETEACE